ncbi:MAG: M56 family metallopeptidase, partial [Clostridia bacterium]|nr:M56 family metallopeptidase [Clostridia bacterium]
MSTLFLHLVNISITASWLIAAVILLRVFLKKAPRAIVCVLWAIVGIRLILPFSIESAVSLIPSRETIPADIALSQHPVVNTGIPQLNAVVNPVIEDSFAPPSPAVSVNPLQIYITFFSIIWLTGMVILLLGAAVSYIRLRKQVSASLPLGEHIRVCDDIPAPFILGVFKPTIYIPSSLTQPHINYVLAHEKAHICRGDFLWKPLGYLLLTVYWYNPLCWAAYILLCRDIEAACDEKVIRSMGREEKASYSQALLDCSFPRRMLTACPLAFGEVGVKSRVRAVLDYKKPAFWLIVLSVFICLVIAVLFLTDPRTEPEQPEIPSFGTTMIFDHYHDHSGYEWGLTLHIEPADFPGTTFRCVSYEKLEMIKGRESIRAYMKTLEPLGARGGYIPFCDHRCPPDVTPENYLYYLDHKEKTF